MTNYDVYFGNKERTLDSLSMLLDYGEGHIRQEVKEFYREVKSIGAYRWLKQECTNPRWYAGIPLIKK
jgi:hypothetical protein